MRVRVNKNPHKSLPFSVEGKILNKLVVIISLIKKLNEDMYNIEERIEKGYPIKVELCANGSGFVYDTYSSDTLFKFYSVQDLENFLKSTRREQLVMGIENGMLRNSTAQEIKQDY